MPRRPVQPLVFDTRELAQRAAAQQAQTRGRPQVIDGEDYAGTVFTRYRVIECPRRGSMNPPAGGGRRFGRVLPLMSGVQVATAGSPDEYVYRTEDLDDALTNFAVRHARGQALILAVHDGRERDDADASLISYVVVAASCWEALYASCDDPLEAMESAGCDLPLPPYLAPDAPGHDAPGPHALLVIMQLAEDLGLRGLDGCRFWIDRDRRSASHLELVLPTPDSLNLFVYFVTESGGLPRDRVRQWRFGASKQFYGENDADMLEGAWGGNQFMIYIPVEDAPDVTAALRQAVARVRSVGSLGRVWRTCEEEIAWMDHPENQLPEVEGEAHDAPAEELDDSTRRRQMHAAALLATYDLDSPTALLESPDGLVLEQFLIMTVHERAGEGRSCRALFVAGYLDAVALGTSFIAESRVAMRRHDGTPTGLLGASVDVYDLDSPAVVAWIEETFVHCDNVEHGFADSDVPDAPMAWHLCTYEPPDDQMDGRGGHADGPVSGPRSDAHRRHGPARRAQPRGRRR